eukprot:12227559-Heterocapsa_arctica.AAC.1
MMRLVRSLDREKRFWSIENPRTSRLWHTKELKQRMSRPDVISVTFAQCQILSPAAGIQWVRGSESSERGYPCYQRADTCEAGAHVHR